MLTWSNLQQEAQDLANDTTATALTFLKTNINVGLHLLESELNSFFIENTRTGVTVASTDTYELPERFIRLKSLYVTVGTTQYHAEEVFDEDLWRDIKANTSGSVSDYLSKVFVRRTSFEVYPTFATADLTYTLIYEEEGKDLANNDYTTGTITTLANAGKAVTGAGATWTSAMIGRYFKINDDGAWYPISAVGSTTGLTLSKAYQGTAIAAGTANYTIGEMPRTPSSTHVIPVYYALWKYYLLKNNERAGRMYKDMWTEYMQWAKATYGNRYSTNYIPSQRYFKNRARMTNPNRYPRNVT